MVLFATAGGLGTRLDARIVQGVATGAALAAAAAAMLDLDQRRGALANSSAPGAGTAVGVPVSALAVQYLPAPTHLALSVTRRTPWRRAPGRLGAGHDGFLDHGKRSLTGFAAAAQPPT